MWGVGFNLTGFHQKRCTACKCVNVFILNRRVEQDEKKGEKREKVWKTERQKKDKNGFDGRSIKLAEFRSTLHPIWHVSIQNGLKVAYVHNVSFTNRKRSNREGIIPYMSDPNRKQKSEQRVT